LVRVMVMVGGASSMVCPSVCARVSRVS
jgi:hypothetical protein